VAHRMSFTQIENRTEMGQKRYHLGQAVHAFPRAQGNSCEIQAVHSSRSDSVVAQH
jgi:hypothetical protein